MRVSNFPSNVSLDNSEKSYQKPNKKRSERNNFLDHATHVEHTSSTTISDELADAIWAAKNFSNTNSYSGKSESAFRCKN